MATYGLNDVKTGLKIMVDGDPYTIVEAEFVKPGKGQAFTRIRIRNLKNGRVWEKTIKASESLLPGARASVRTTSIRTTRSESG